MSLSKIEREDRIAFEMLYEILNPVVILLVSIFIVLYIYAHIDLSLDLQLMNSLVVFVWIVLLINCSAKAIKTLLHINVYFEKKYSTSAPYWFRTISPFLKDGGAVCLAGIKFIVISVKSIVNQVNVLYARTEILAIYDLLINNIYLYLSSDSVYPTITVNSNNSFKNIFEKLNPAVIRATKEYLEGSNKDASVRYGAVVVWLEDNTRTSDCVIKDSHIYEYFSRMSIIKSCPNRYSITRGIQNVKIAINSYRDIENKSDEDLTREEKTIKKHYKIYKDFTNMVDDLNKN